MIVYIYDKTFEGLLTAIFDSYFRKVFPDVLCGEGETLPLFYSDIHKVTTDVEKSERVWKGLEKKLTKPALGACTYVWLSELVDSDKLLFRYIYKVFDSPRNIETNFGDPDVLEMSKVARKVSREKLHVIQFIRFQRTADNIYFGALKPLYNVFPLTISHFKDRFSDQQWVIYDLKRAYGYYYDLKEVKEIVFQETENHLITGKLDENLMAEDEKLFQQMWKEYFKALTIKERINPKLHAQNMPRRFWQYLTEKQ